MSEKMVDKATNPAISVVLATKGTKLVLLERCIKSLQNQSFRNFEIILVYKIFPEQLRELFRTCNIATLKENSSTLGAARNLGVKHAKGELVAFIDDDAEAPKNWLQNIFSTFQRYPTLVCLGGPHFTPREELHKNPWIFTESSFLESHMQKTYLDRAAIGKIAGCNVTYRKTVFNEIGYLDEKLRTCEDWEFHRRLAENGYNMRFDPEISVWHHRQGVKHIFNQSSNMIPFYLSWKTFKYSKSESIFASFYLTNLLVLLLILSLLISPFIFFLLFSFVLLARFAFAVLRTRTYNWRIVYYPLIIVLTLVRIMGFYYGLLKYVATSILFMVARKK